MPAKPDSERDIVIPGVAAVPTAEVALGRLATARRSPASRTPGPLAALGTAYNSKGEFEAADDYFRRSLATRRHTLGNDHPDVASSLHDLGNNDYRRARYDDAEAHLGDPRLALDELLLRGIPGHARRSRTARPEGAFTSSKRGAATRLGLRRSKITRHPRASRS